MPALHTDLSVEQGSTFVLEFQVFTDELQPLSLLTSEINAFGTLVYSIDDYNVRMKIRKSKYRDPILFTIGTTMTYAFQPGSTQGFVQNGVFFLGGAIGFMRLVLTADTTAAFKAGRYFYDMELVQNVSGGEIVSKLLSGKMEVEAESTR
jgi:hypothetical protein